MIRKALKVKSQQSEMVVSIIGQSWPRCYSQDKDKEDSGKEKSPLLRKMQEEMEMDIKALKWRRDFKQNENKSKLKVFANEEQTSDFLVWMQKPISLDPRDWKKKFVHYLEKQEEGSQEFIAERYDILGPDLAASHFIIFRGGSVKFQHSNEWFKADKNLDFDLPNKYDPLYKVEAIKCDNMKLHYVGLNNLRWLQYLRSLSFHNVELFDDWCLDRVSSLECPKLETLDISKTKCTHNGLSCLYRLNALKLLIVSDRKATVPFELSCALLEQSNPLLQIVNDDNQYRL